MTGGELIVKYLVNQGIKVIFGVPGNQLRELYSGLYKHQNSIRHINCRHEGGASLMADGYAKATGEISVCMVSPGPGASNAYVGVAEAYTSCSPVLLITVSKETEHTGKGQEIIFHGLDHAAAFAPVTRWASKVTRAEDIPYTMQKAFEHLIGGRPGPVMLEFTIESLKAEVDATIPDKFTFSKKEPQEEAILEIAKIINNSHKPFIIAGREVFALKAEKELSEFAKAIAAPIITTCMGKGVVSDFEDYSLGSILNINYYKKMESLAQESDLCIAIGNRFTQVDTDNWSMKLPKTLVSITIDDSFINKDYTSDYSLTGNIKSNLQLLLSNLEKKELNLDWNNFVTNFKKQIDDISFPKIVSDIRATLNRDGILVNDVHSEGFPTCGHFKVYEPSNYIQSAISLGVGYALPAAIGAKIAFPDRQVIAFSGDGGFLMSSPDFSTAMKYGINVVFVIVNDNAFGTIKKGQPEHLHDTIGLDLYNPDFMDFAKAYKAKSFRVNDLSDFRLVLKKALEMNEPVIIEVVKKNNQI